MPFIIQSIFLHLRKGFLTFLPRIKISQKNLFFDVNIFFRPFQPQKIKFKKLIKCNKNNNNNLNIFKQTFFGKLILTVNCELICSFTQINVFQIFLSIFKYNL